MAAPLVGQTTAVTGVNLNSLALVGSNQSRVVSAPSGSPLTRRWTSHHQSYCRARTRAARPASLPCATYRTNSCSLQRPRGRTSRERWVQRMHAPLRINKTVGGDNGPVAREPPSVPLGRSGRGWSRSADRSQSRFVIQSRTDLWGASGGELTGDRLRHQDLAVEAWEKFDLFEQD